MSNFKLTGKIRYRIEKRLFKNPILVLQVKEEFDDGPPDFNGMPTYLAGVQWRDARVEDVLELRGCDE